VTLGQGLLPAALDVLRAAGEREGDTLRDTVGESDRGASTNIPQAQAHQLGQGLLPATLDVLQVRERETHCETQ
jgi:hypothetical protein